VYFAKMGQRRTPGAGYQGELTEGSGVNIGTRFTIKVNNGCLVLIANSLEEKRQDERQKQLDQQQAAMDLKQVEMEQTIQKLRSRV